jgi:hypothetical protein
VEIGDLLLRIAHDRGEDFVDVAPQHAPKEWEPIALALMAIKAKLPVVALDDLPARPSFLGLSELAPQLKSQFTQLNAAYSIARYPNTKQILEIIHSFPQYSRLGVLVRKESARATVVPHFREI